MRVLLYLADILRVNADPYILVKTFIPDTDGDHYTVSVHCYESAKGRRKIDVVVTYDGTLMSQRKARLFIKGTKWYNYNIYPWYNAGEPCASIPSYATAKHAKAIESLKMGY